MTTTAQFTASMSDLLPAPLRPAPAFDAARPQGMPQLALLKSLIAIAVGFAMYFMVHPLLLPFFWAPVAAAIAWRGDREAWIVALSGPINILVSIVGPKLGLFPGLYSAGESRLGVLSIDTITALVLLVIAVKSSKWWPSWAAAFEFLMVASHLIFIFGGGLIQPWAYVSSIVIWTWFKYILLSFVALDLCVRPNARAPRSSAIPVLLMIPMLGFVAVDKLEPPVYAEVWQALVTIWILIVVGANVWSARAHSASRKLSLRP